jgi:predicted TIM-barrel enzyme/DNA-binding NtrC family response regulator
MALELKRRKGTLLIGAWIGTGATARATAAGGADFLVAINAARFRMMGAPSTASLLPLKDTNDFVPRFAEEEILPFVSVPVFLGAAAFDPASDLSRLVAGAKRAGFAGVANFPSVVRYGGRYRACLEAAGVGLSREIEMLREARRIGLMTLAYAKTKAEAIAFADAGADIMCLFLGSNASSGPDEAREAGVDQAITFAQSVFRAVRAHSRGTLLVISGGPILSPAHLVEFCAATKADGYVGGSTIDRIPVEPAIESRVAEFKFVSPLRRRLKSEKRSLETVRRSVDLIGDSPRMAQIFEALPIAARARESVFIGGETGTGKTSIAKALHHLATPGRGRFDAIISPSSPNELLLDLFGCAPGFDARASAGRTGRFETLRNGTLAIEQIERLGPEVLDLIAHAAIDGDYVPFGGLAKRPLQTRIIYVSDLSLRELHRRRRISDSFYYALLAQNIQLPSLRERDEDIEPIAHHILTGISRQRKGGRLELHRAALRHLRAHHWPGNVRELISIIRRAAESAKGAHVTLANIKAVLESPDAPETADANAGEKAWILSALRKSGFRRGETAEILGVSRKTLYNKMKRLGLS